MLAASRLFGIKALILFSLLTISFNFRVPTPAEWRGLFCFYFFNHGLSNPNFFKPF
jgi:hypothetical protein